MAPELSSLVKAYERSRITRLGVCYMETPKEYRRELASETGETVLRLSSYANKVKKYFPHTQEVNETSNRWTDEEDNYLMEHYQTRPIEQVMAHLHPRTRLAIQKHASLLGVNKKQQDTLETKTAKEMTTGELTESEIDKLADYYQKHTLAETAKHFGMSPSALKSFMSFNGVTKQGRTSIGEREKQIAAFYMHNSKVDTLEQFGISDTTLVRIVNQIGMKKRTRPRVMKGSTDYSPLEKQLRRMQGKTYIHAGGTGGYHKKVVGYEITDEEVLIHTDFQKDPVIKISKINAVHRLAKVEFLRI